MLALPVGVLSIGLPRDCLTVISAIALCEYAVHCIISNDSSNIDLNYFKKKLFAVEW